MEHLPVVGSILDVSLPDGRGCRLMVQRVSDQGLILAPTAAAEIDPLPADGLTSLRSLGWLVNRSWFAVPIRDVTLSAGAWPRWRVEFADEPHPANRRRYMRGGGGEPIQLGDRGAEGEDVLVAGRVVDLSEGGVRCWVPELGRETGDETAVQVSLNGAAVTINGRVYDKRRAAHGDGLDAVVVYALNNSDATVIRRYLFQRELAARRVRDW